MKTEPLQRLMSEATRLTRAGRLREATDAILRTLSRSGRRSASDSDRAPPVAGSSFDRIDENTIDIPDLKVVDEPDRKAAASNDGQPDVDATLFNGTLFDGALFDGALFDGSLFDRSLFDRTRGDSGDTYGDEADGAAPAVPDPGVARRGEAFIDGAHRHRGRSLRYKLYVPPVAGQVWPEAADRHPLVVMLHGCTQDPDDFARGTQMNRLARDQGCYVLYPGQSRDANPSGCWNWFEPAHQRRGAGEPAAIVAVVEWVRQQYPIDPDRIYVAGLSAGGAMAAILGDAYPDVFAAVGVHSGLPPGAARNLPEALAAMKRGAAPTTNRKADATRPPTIVFHGNRDRTVHPSNGDSLVSEVADAAAEPLSRVTTTGASNGSRSFTRTLHCAPGGQPIAEHWTIHGGGHAWFGGSQSGRFADPRGPDASREMLRFFLEKRRRPT